MSACIGCRACHMACKDVHDLSVGPILRRVRAFEVGVYPNVDGYRYASACYHCENAACVGGCSLNALYYDDDGTVQLDKATCIGCMVCSSNCPYGAPQPDEERGVMVKCDTCKTLREMGQNPACVDSCLMRCLKFGDLSELEARYGPGLVNELPILPPAGDSGPRVLIKPKPCSLSTDFREVDI